MTYSIILATNLNGGIGFRGKIPWVNKWDMKNFKNKTIGNVVVMGRKTWESLPFGKLPNRKNVILSTTLSARDDDDVVVVNSIENLLHVDCKTIEIFIIGGKFLYEYFLKKNLVKKIYLTIEDNYDECDVFVDLSRYLDDGDFDVKVFEKHSGFSYYEYEKNLI